MVVATRVIGYWTYAGRTRGRNKPLLPGFSATATILLPILVALPETGPSPGSVRLPPAVAIFSPSSCSSYLKTTEELTQK